jgi:hypothetical protein
MKNNRMSPAKKAEPLLSNIPIPISDHPLVIDLPDGQKLVLGKLNSGSVIEVATWRGTGRPDSRTNRLMLGMNDGSPAVNNPSNSAKANVDVEDQKKVITLPWTNVSLPKVSIPKIDPTKIKAIKDKIAKVDMKKIKSGLDSAINAVAKMRAKSKDLSPIETTAELDINAWIESISREASIKANRSRVGNSQPAKRSPSSASKAKSGKTAKRKPSKGR